MKGIPFKPWKIKAISEQPDKEWQTRRLAGLKEINQYPDEWIFKGLSDDGKYWFQHPQCERYHYLYNAYIKPRFQVGDVAYIKEVWGASGYGKGLPIVKEAMKHRIVYGAEARGQCKRSPLFMPEWAARHFLRVTGVRPERLQSITPEDCEAEGVLSPNKYGWLPDIARLMFQLKWDFTNPKHPWSKNEWVFCHSFIKVDKLESCPEVEKDYGS